MTNKLNEAFKRCAGKVVDLNRMALDIIDILDPQLSEEEFQQYVDTQVKRSANVAVCAQQLLINPGFRTQWIAAVGDGTIGAYRDGSGHDFVNVNQLKFMEMVNDLTIKLPASISDRVLEATAQAIDMAQDYRGDVKSGKLQPVMR